MALQFACVGIIVLTGPAVHLSIAAGLVIATSVFLGMWAVFSMRLGRFHITPTLHPLGQLTRRGPYRLVRHPMYLALILAMLGAVINEPSPIRIAAWLSLVVILVLKLRMEERLLAERYVEYITYAASTWRLLPFVY